MIYIFLDIDWVLNNAHNSNYYGIDVDPLNIHYFNKLLEELKNLQLEYKIIITSDWKNYPLELNDLFNSFIDSNYSDTTKLKEGIQKPIDKILVREFEIKEYLKKIKDCNFEYIIIDDFDLKFDKLIKTDYESWFCKEHIIQFLNKLSF